jgi:nicotinamidase-related amidase
VEALPGVEIIDRSSVNAFDDERVARAIAATGRKKLIFAGISLEVCAAFRAITAVGKGLDACVAVDASGTFSETKRLIGLLRSVPRQKEKLDIRGCPAFQFSGTPGGLKAIP